jgi:hypothetical protein
MNLTRPVIARPLAAALALLFALAVTPALAARARTAATTKITITKFAVSGSKITLDGKVSLSASAARRRKRAVLLVTVIDTHGELERFTAKIGARDRFAAVHDTKLTGALRLTAAVTISGRANGKTVVRTFDVGAPGSTGSGSTPGKATTPSGSGTPSSPSSPTSPTSPETPTGPVALQGTFDITPATEVKGAVKGSWFEMLIPGNRAPLQNGNSPLTNNPDYTPLSPGTSGGLLTTAYQPAPNPAFEKQKTGEGLNALADEIMQPQDFQGDNFSVVTEAVDHQNKSEADPIPHIIDTAGKLSGQVTAWVVGWNNQWFNQGSPKPNGLLPEETTAPTGTYNSATGQYVLEWKSAIIGGPFNGFLGSWHLEGTFVP